MAVLALHRHEPKEDYSYIYWFLVAVAYKVPWTAISSLLGQFSYQFQQPRILLYLNLAYFIPSVPALLIHSSIQERLEKRYGVPKAALLRFAIGLGGLSLLSLLFPQFCSSPQLLLSATAAVGVLYSIAFGTSYQVVTHFPPTCTVALTTGFVSCGIVVLIADLLFKRGAYYTPSGLNHLFQVVAVQTALGLLAATTVLRRHWRRLAAAAAAGDLPAAATAGGGGVGRSANGKVIIGLPSQNSSNGVNGGGRVLLRVPSPAAGWLGNSGSSNSGGYEQQQQQYNGSLSSAAGAAVSGGHYTADGLRHRSDVEGQQQQQQWSGDLSAETGAAAAAAGAAVAIHFNDPASPKKHQKRSSSGGCGLQILTSSVRDMTAPLLELLRLGRVIWPACLGIMMSVGSSMMVFPFFTFVPHTGYFGEHIPQVLFYSRLLGDIAGRLMPHQLHLRSSKAVLAAAAAKTKLLMLLIPALINPYIVGGDIPLALLVALNWWMSGYVNTGAYLLAPKLAAAAASSSSRKGLGSGSGAKTKAGGLMAFCFQTSCFLGLMGAWFLQSVVMAEWSHHAYSAAAAAVGESGMTEADTAMQDGLDFAEQQQQGMLSGGLAAAALAAQAAVAHEALDGSTVH